MSDFDFVSAQTKITAINKIVETCAEPVKEKAFELLFKLVFDGPAPGKHSKPTTVEKAKTDDGEKRDTAAAHEVVKLPGNVLAFLRRHSVHRETLDKLFMLDQTPHLPVYKIDASITSKAQLQKVLMILLENAILSGSFKAPYKEIRASCKEVGLFDGNFNKTLKSNAGLFKGAVTTDKINDDAELELTGTKKFKVDSLSELQKVFDTDLLWVLEYLELIDSNQHQRLRTCFDLRNHSAHPGQAPVEPENVLAFYSDITKIVLKNSKFS